MLRNKSMEQRKKEVEVLIVEGFCCLESGWASVCLWEVVKDGLCFT